MRAPIAVGVLLAVGCLEPGSGELSKAGRIEGQLIVSEGSRGDAYVFLYPHGRGLPAEAVEPRALTAVSDLRLARGDTRYLFGSIAPNPYRVWPFLDVDRNFRVNVDVLAQPGAGDRLGVGVEVNLQPGEHRQLDLRIGETLAHEPPAFRLEGEKGETVELPDRPLAPIVLTMVSDDVGVLDPARLGFRVSLADDDQDGAPDDADGDGLLDLYPRVFLRFLPRPGQTVPEDSTVILPMVFNPGPFLSNLGFELDAEIVADRLQTVVVPVAQAISNKPGRGRQATTLDAIPIGEWELVVLAKTGQYWRLPNDLGATLTSQAVCFRFIHATAR
ncbi:MAG: hypothetical protein ACOZIN_08295 [Myxococcota bacterium]